MTTPSDIEIMIHCRCRVDPHPRLHAPAVRESFERFMKAGMIEAADKTDVYKATDRGAAWVEALCAVPFPEEAWISRSGGLLFVGGHTETWPERERHES